MRRPYIRLRTDTATPIYMQIAEQLVDGIRRREWKYEDKLPGVRELSNHLNVSLETVQRAYHVLQQQGWVESKSRRGTIVTADVVTSPIPLPKPEAEKHAHFVHELRRCSNLPGIIPVSGGTALADKEQLQFFQAHVQECVRLATMEESFDPFGIPELRSRLQGWLTLYGAYSRMEQLCVVSGTQQALQLIASLEVTQDSIVFVPEMCYLAAQEVFRDHGARIYTLPIGSDGIDLSPLEQALKSRRVSLVYAMPNGLYPTGWSYSLDQKKKLLEWSQSYRFTLVEDDYYAGFYYGEQPPVSMLSLADPTTPLYYLASFSHLTHPSFRLGMMVCPAQMVGKMERKKFLADGHTSTLNQHLLLKLLESESFEDSLSVKRALYRKRRNDAMASCSRWLPASCIYHPSDCGFSSWVTTPRKLGFSFFHACLEEGILAMPDEAFSLTDAHAGFQINFAALEAQYLDEGIRRIAQVLHRRNLCM